MLVFSARMPHQPGFLPPYLKIDLKVDKSRVYNPHIKNVSTNVSKCNRIRQAEVSRILLTEV
jgi:hypothetical protein